jgi:hypothetical protein
VIRLGGREFTRNELLRHVGRLEQLAGVELFECADGSERGVRLLRFSSGTGFAFEVLVDRGFDVGRAWHGATPLAWWSPVGALAPWYHDSSGVEWFRGFPGGLVSTCGLDHTLLGGSDESAHFNYPHRTREAYGLHGRYAGLPATLVGYGSTWSGDDCTFWAEGDVRQVAIFGEQLTLHRRIELDLGGDVLRIRDVVTNIGFTECTHMILYHCNIGFPVIDAGAELAYPAAAGVCVSDACDEDYRTLIAPQRDYVEQCYEHDMRAGADGLVTAAVINDAAKIGVYQRYALAQLPHHITWRNLCEGSYVLAMEPSTNRDAGRFDARERGELMFLQPGEQRSYQLDIGVALGDDALGALRRCIATPAKVTL